MAVEYRIRFRTPLGVVLDEFTDIIELDYARGINRVGSMTLLLPPRYENILGPILPVRHKPWAFGRHYQLEIWRKARDSSAWYLEGNTSWLITRPARWITKNNERLIRIKAVDAVFLLTTRVIAYDTDSPKRAIDGVHADDGIKKWVNDNMGTGALAGRDLVTPGYISIAGNVGLAPLISQESSWEPLLTVVQEATDRSEQGGRWLCYDFDTTTGNFPWEFKTFVDRRGTNRTLGHARPVILSYWTGEIVDIPFEENYEEEYTFVYGGGPGSGASRVMVTAQDVARIASSPFGRREIFEQARGAKTSTEVGGAANARLAQGNPRRFLTSIVEDTFHYQYGREFFYGDQLLLEMDTERLDVRMDSVHNTFSDGQESKKMGWELIAANV